MSLVIVSGCGMSFGSQEQVGTGNLCETKQEKAPSSCTPDDGTAGRDG